MLIFWLATYALHAALIVLFEETLWPFRDLSTPRRGSAAVAGPFAQVMLKKPRAGDAAGARSRSGRSTPASSFAQEPIQYDFRKLGSRSGQHQGAGFWDKHLDAVMQSYQTPTVIFTESPSRRGHRPRAREGEGQEGPNGTIESVATLQEFLPRTKRRSWSSCARSSACSTTGRGPSFRPRCEGPARAAASRAREVSLKDLPARHRPASSREGRPTRAPRPRLPDAGHRPAHGRVQMIAFARGSRRSPTGRSDRAQVAGLARAHGRHHRRHHQRRRASPAP